MAFLAALPRPRLLWPTLALACLLWGPAHADPPAGPTVRVEKVKQKPESRERKEGTNLVFLKGQLGWLVAGGVGALVPLLLFALPFAWTATFGPFYAPFFVVALLWGTLMVGGGGLAAYLIQLLFSDRQSGILIPVASAAGVGLLGTFLSGVLALAVFWPFFLMGAWYDGYAYGTSPQRHWQYWYASPFSGVGIFLAFMVWTAGIVVTSVAGPVLAAYLYYRLGVRRHGSDVRFSFFTGDDLEEDIGRLTESEPAGESKGHSKGKASPSGGGGGGGGGSKKGRSGPNSKSVGASCSSPGECQGTCSKAREWGGGMCTTSCEDSDACPANSVCVDATEPVCAVSCTKDSDCSAFIQGFVCKQVDVRKGESSKVCQVP